MNSELVELRAIAYKYASKLVDYPYDEDVEKMDETLSDFVTVFTVLEQLNEKYRGIADMAKNILTILDDINRLGRDNFQAEYVSTF